VGLAAEAHHILVERRAAEDSQRADAASDVQGQEVRLVELVLAGRHVPGVLLLVDAGEARPFLGVLGDPAPIFYVLSRRGGGGRSDLGGLVARAPLRVDVVGTRRKRVSHGGQREQARDEDTHAEVRPAGGAGFHALPPIRKGGRPADGWSPGGRGFGANSKLTKDSGQERKSFSRSD